jgi:hypothetical protein
MSDILCQYKTPSMSSDLCEGGAQDQSPNNGQNSASAADGARNTSKNKGDNTNRNSVENGDQGGEEKKEWNEFSNIKEKIEMKSNYSTFEFLKIILYQQKKEKRHQEYLSNKDNVLAILPATGSASADKIDKQKFKMASVTRSPKEILSKLFKSRPKDESADPVKKKRGITVLADEPHSIVDEVFSWVKI